MRGENSLLRIFRLAFIIIVVVIDIAGCSTQHAQPEQFATCIHDQIADRKPYMVNLASQKETIHKRDLGYSNIRIHPILDAGTYAYSEFVQGDDSALSRALDTLQRALLIHPVQGNLTIPPMCEEYTTGLNEGKCISPLPNQTEFQCGDLASGIVPHEYIGTREVCNSSNGSCTVEGPDGPGLPNADYLLFVSISHTFSCWFGLYAYASYCMLDMSDNNRPVAGFINICPLTFRKLAWQEDIIYGLFMHEIIHALGFSRRLFDKFVDANGNQYYPVKEIIGPYGTTFAFTGPKTIEVAKQYYACDDIQGVYLENEGGSGTASSHWDKRTLNHEVMVGYIPHDYVVLSEFTLALFEDSGWYKADYSVLYYLKQNSLLWGKGLGCSFLTERCTNNSVFPYLCDPAATQLGNCSSTWPGFDDCPVAVASEPEHYCRTTASVDYDPIHNIENYGNSSICAVGVRSLSCSTIRVTLCMAQETYTVNGENRYALQIIDQKYQCKDGHALVSDSYFSLLCPPIEKIISQSPSILNGVPSLSPSPSTTLISADIDILETLLRSNKSIVSFGELKSFRNVNITLVVSKVNISNTNFICLSYGCVTCTAPIVVQNNTIILDADRLYSVTSRTFVASAVFIDSLTKSSHYSLVLMLDAQSNHPFIYYAASVDFVGNYLQTLHLNDDYFIRIVAISSNAEIRIAPSQDIYMNESYYIFHREETVYTLDIGETITVSSKKDLTGTRVTASSTVLFYSGHYCASGKTTACSILHEQIPPYNSWGNTFVLRTNVDSVKGSMFKIVASDVGANVFMNCTTDGTDYITSTYYLGFREHIAFSVTHDYCAVKSDENILIIQFKDSSPPWMDTFMTIIPALVHYEDHYVITAHKGFENYIAITVKNTDIATNSMLLDDSPIAITWNLIELDGDVYYFTTLRLSEGRHTLAFLKNSIVFGVILYGSSKNDTFAYPAGMRLNLKNNFPNKAPSAVRNLEVKLFYNIILISWSPPLRAYGTILQYIVQRVTSSGKSYHYVLGSENYLILSYSEGVAIFVAAVNQYGQSIFEVARMHDPCQPSPCINDGTCTFFGINNLYCNCTNSYSGQFCQSGQLYPFGQAYNDVMLPSYSYRTSALVLLSDEIIFYNTRTRIVYINANGIISLDNPFTSFFIRPLTRYSSSKIIIPYWVSFDTTSTGKVFYRQTTDINLLARATNEIRQAFRISYNFTIGNLLIVTWDSVQYYYSGSYKMNTFQCILASSQYESFVIFLYADIQWTSFGTLAGINSGNGYPTVTVPESQTLNILNIEETSNIGVPGVWMFKIGEECQPSIHTCVSEFYSFGLMHGDATLPGEGSTVLRLSSKFFFYEETVTSVYVNDNGIISFHSSFSRRTPWSLPLRSYQFVAPYWADVDIRGTGEIFYRQSTDPSLLARASLEITNALSINHTIEIKHLLIATWNAVGYYYSNTDKVNTFQCILATSDSESFVIFLYSDLQWTTGSASLGYRGLGRNEALAGYNAGDGINSYTIPGSQTSEILKLSRTSNVGIPGTWIFKVGKDCFRYTVTDVVFVIDTSSGIGSSRFQLVREIIENVTINLKMYSPETLFGLITFDDYARFEFNITNHTDLSTLLPAINPGIPYHGGGSTHTASALSLLLSGGGEGGYLNLRNKTLNVVIVITDHASSSYSSLQSAATSLHTANIFDVYAVGIGFHSYSDLQLIATNPSYIVSTYVYDDFSAQQLVVDMEKRLCSIHTQKIILKPNSLQQGVIGEMHELVCLTTISSTAPSNLVELTWNFVSNDTRVRVIPATVTTDDSIGTTYATMIQFDYLTKADKGNYNCSMIIGDRLTESTFVLETINPIFAVEAKITGVARIYQPFILQCIATIVRGITSTVDIIWTTDNTQVRRVNNVTASSNINSSSIYNDSFIIPSLNISDIGRVYECEVLVNSVLPTSAKANIVIPIPRSKCLSTYAALDTVFVIDTSGSIGSSNFQLIREFTASITIELIQNFPSSAVGVILFASTAQIQFNLQTYTSLSSLLSVINLLPYSSGGTDTAEALTLLLSIAQNGSLGLRNDSSKVAIVITDGQSNNPSATLSAAAALHASNIFDVFAVGVDGADVLELEEIASSSEFVFFTDSFATYGLQQLQDRILPQLCNSTFLNITLQSSGSDENAIGQRLSIVCSISVPPDVDPGTIELGWFNEEDIVTNDSRVTIYESSDYFNDNTLFTIIQFDPLTEQDEGEYICYAVINGSYLIDSVNLQKFSIPTPKIFLRPNHLQQGTVGEPHDLVCSITLSSVIQADSVYLTWKFASNDARVTVIPTTTTTGNSSGITYTTVIWFDYLTELDEGYYTCLVEFLLSFKTYSAESTFNLETIIPIPVVQIAISDNGSRTLRNLTIGDSLTLDCIVTTVRGISSSVNFIWTTGGIELRRVDDITANRENDSTIYIDSFEISSLSTFDNGKEYQCTVMINATQPVYGSDQFTLIFPAPVCFITTYCGGESFSDISISFDQCCFELSGVSFASSGQCFQCPNDGACQPSIATCVSEFYYFGILGSDSVLRNTSIDVTSQALFLSESFYFYDEIINTVYVGDNGIISLNDSFNAWTPRILPLNNRFIAPYWADTDLTGTGQIYYHQSKHPTLLARATNEIQRVFPLSHNLNITNLFIVTWDAVGFYSKGTNKTNTFQCVLATTKLESFVIFLYADGKIQWTTGDASGGSNGLGGTEALAGINAGDGINFTTIPGSLNSSIINITQTSNIGIPGVWIFKVGEDINECAGDHGCHHLCNNTAGSFHCYCNPGYMLHSNGTTCTDINECLVDNGGCEFFCTNLEGINITTGLGYQCGCDYGYQLAPDNHNCSDIPNCLTNNHNCSQICVAVEGSFNCSCYPGYQLQQDRVTCTDIDECAEGSDRCSHNCTNIAGGYMCFCMDGYQLESDNHTCTDINECEDGISGCQHICNNTFGSFDCSCNPGYALNSDSKSCIDIDECIERSVCDHNCTNTDGSYHCACVDGYGLKLDNHTCADIDECSLNIDDCDQSCVNDNGSYHCECYTGYFRGANSSSCVDINECAGDHGCHQLCNNTAGSFHCYCNPGYMLHSNGTTCSDVNECFIGNGGCESSCTNLEGINNTTGLGYQCGCDNGYQLAPDNHDCNDILNCIINNHNCSQKCVEVEGSFNCSCYPGYKLQEDEVNCIDINECLVDNGGCEFSCTNLEGINSTTGLGYQCGCDNGYQLAPNNHNCTDIDECIEGTDACDHNCTNTDGSYYCTCMDGYELESDNHTCTDENECLINNGGCAYSCRNLQGSFECFCNNSYSFEPDKTICIDNSSGCTYILRENSGHISAPGLFNSSYSICTWMIWLPGYKSVELKFDKIDIENSPDCAKDRVTVLNGIDEDSVSLGSYCGDKLPATIKSSTETVTIKFITSNGNKGKTGFSLHYRGLTVRSKGLYVCNSVISRTTTFALPAFPSKYKAPIDCVFYFIPPYGKSKVKLTFLYLDILTADCGKDQVEIYDGFSNNALKTQICNGSKIVEFLSSQPYVRMKYIGKSSNKYRGFHAFVTFL